MTGLVTKAGVTEEVFATGFEGSSDIHLPLVFNAFFLRNFSPSIVLYLWTSLMCIAPIFFFLERNICSTGWPRESVIYSSDCVSRFCWRRDLSFDSVCVCLLPTVWVPRSRKKDARAHHWHSLARWHLS